MDEYENSSLDINGLCRFCLKTQNETVDLFQAGIYDVITAATRLELHFLEGLPKSVCLECKRQAEEIYRFVCLIKSSDDRLVRFATKQEKHIRQEDARVLDESRGEKEELYLIVVPEADSTRLDHTYPKEQAAPREPAIAYSSDLCTKTFGNISNFLNHFYECLVDFPKCPVCCMEIDAVAFGEHLSSHEVQGVNALNWARDRWKVYKINLKDQKCKRCEGLSVSEEIFSRHAKKSRGAVFGKDEEFNSHRSLDGLAPESTSDRADPLSVEKGEISSSLSTAEGTIRRGNSEHGFLPGKNYSCEFCSRTFATKTLVTRHLKLQHLKSKEERVCEKCGWKFLDKTDYERHFSSRHAKNIACPVCNKIFSDRTKLRRHSAFHVIEQNGAVCEICGTEFSTDSGLSKHKRIHSAEEGVDKCKICYRTFSNGKSLEKHEAAHSDPNFFECSICRLPLPSLNRLERHSEIHSRNRATWECDVCDLSFLSKDGLSCHRSRTGHVGNREPLECNVCHEKFHVAKKFARHVKLHPKYKTSECSLCGKRLSTSQSLSLHTKRHFESDGILCPECGKRFFEERNYRRHLLTHSGIRPYPCDYPGCGKSFYTLFEIKRHKKYHFDTRDFPCPYCSKKFHESNHLKVHTRIHTGEKPYVCPHCRKGFVTRTRCKQHIKLIHRGEGYELIQTDISKKVPVFDAVKSFQKNMKE